MGNSEKINEKFIQWIWGNKKIVGDLRTVSNKPLKIIFPGIPNFEDGPDFKNAIIEFDKRIKQDWVGRGNCPFPGTRLKGDIEIHLSSRDWFSHKHNTDPKYNNVILHVIVHDEYCRDAKFCVSASAITSKGKEIETLVLSKCLQKPLQELYEEFTVSNMKIEHCPHKSLGIDEVLFNQGIARFNMRKQKFRKLIELHHKEQAIYIGIMEALGYVKNESAFVKLANYVPIQILKRLTNGKNKDERIEIIKAVLLGVAGFIPDDLKNLWEEICEKEKFPDLSRLGGIMRKEEWQFFKVRPKGFPQYRIRNISYFLADAVEDGICDLLLKQELDIKRLSVCISQEKFGKSYVNTVILNVYLPVLSILSPSQQSVGQASCLSSSREEDKVMELYKNYKALPQNNITNFMSNLLLDGKRCQKEIYNQGMLHLFHKYCSHKANPPMAGKGKNCNACPVKKFLLTK